MFEVTELRLRQYLQVLRRHRSVILLVTLLTVGLGVLPVLFQDPTYASTTELRVGSERAESPFAGRTEDEQTRSRELVSEVEVIQSSQMRAKVEERLGPDAEPFGDVRATLVGLSEIIKVRVVASSAPAAADAANTYAEVFVEERRERSVHALNTQADELRRQSEEVRSKVTAVDAQLADPLTNPQMLETLRLERGGLVAQQQDLDRRADQLEVEAALREGGTEIVSVGTLELEPVAPRPVKTALVSLVLGMLAGIAVAVLLEILQDRLTSPEDLAAIDPAIRVLAAVPHMDDTGRRTSGTVLPSAAGEAYRYLRTALRFHAQLRSVSALVVTSAVSAEGKTTTAVNLALAMADAGRRVVLIDADIRRPAVHQQLNLGTGPGLTTVLTGGTQFADAVHYVQPTLAVLTAGPPVPNPNELLGTSAFVELVASVKAQCDVLIIDVPPVLPVADPILAGRLVDGALVVCRLGLVRRRDVRALLGRLRDAGLPAVGFVANDADLRSAYDDYEAYADREAVPMEPPQTSGSTH